ncbi:uncharacterized protein LY89DRAFT_494779 [Mollisia scopiformis]|uniref:Uncharacterized protein n=1 Tax=Mollisia scopiformis TaxID=149040 RepID=A0A194XHD4_MOLSC|nr:uncharacterized protein LY89DRAFT_494779 [Mollisia scopiformis]KUJ19573.1 hypothetical protein LY89DRAFT_494779 [Mollisia scopiformis]
MYCWFDALSLLKEQRSCLIHTELTDDNGNTPWDCFVFVHSVQPTHLGLKQPSNAEREAFEDLYKAHRNGRLQNEIEYLEIAFGEVINRQSKEAITTLSRLSEDMKKQRNLVAAETYRVISLQIRQNMWEAAIEAVRERFEALQAEMKSSPWDREVRVDNMRISHLKVVEKKAIMTGGRI